jgi:uncharacterized membrane protein YccC
LTLVRDSARLLAEGEKGAPSAARVRLNGAIDALAASLRNAPAKPAEIAKRLFDMAPMADALVECARARSLERGGAADAEIIVWAEAVRNCILAHRSDIDFLTPWASLLATEILAGDEVVASLDTMPTLTALPTRCKAASQMLANRPRDGGGEDLARLVSALAKSASAAQMVLVARFNQFERI